ncbi:hypothetical protein DNU06_13925 [Putridiphycobacter roseus]|uniref:Amino acid permease/ SLC12A domain-containing protein n=1 Tax=Putridiphycobacter roseus TaxID=2219161 RepID=A0A2W1NKN3_9FLAO|nr:amino acid permease [Putridiphycobacter roseus]PZE16222.1 hypothetical protein DNU06_13925 [Putridiphycobacter roseus]
MSEQKKFGTFAGVFTPSILTILGVMLYLLFGKVVGNAGLGGTIIIIIIAHIISISTGLSVSSIATDKKVGAGGVYYVLSRSLGLPIGGALGITLFVATAISIALYMVGFAEVFNSILDINFVEIKQVVNDQEVKSYLVNDSQSFFNGWSDIDLIRFTGTIGLILLTVIALISTSIAIKTQFIILILIVLSLVAIAFGDPSLATVFTKSAVNPANRLDYFEAFALFFPAVTGFTAGVAMSGDLKNPKKSIPIGTMLAIAVGFVVYMLVAIFLFYNFSSETLIENTNLLYEITLYGGIFVILGAIGATLSSAIGGILGAPRILQAMSVDKITPKLFAKGVGKEKEPRNALLLTVFIAESGVLIGQLEVIAVILTVFYLAAYGFINLSFFLESWASADFNPSFKVNKWFGLIGFIATFTIMSQISILSMILALVIISGIYLYLNNKQVSLGTGDIWQSVWSTIVKKGLRKMETSNDHKRNWKPNILLFSGGNESRDKYIEFSKAIAGQTGIITNFDLIENKEAKVLFPKHKQCVKDEELEKYGIFGKQIEVQNEFKGIESIASTFGFSGIEPNTILMQWPGETKDPVWFTDMTQKLFDLDFNVLYLDYDKRWGFRKKETIDLWWRSVGNNAELMLSLVKFISHSTDWAKANIRVLLVNDTNTENQIIENRIQQVVDQFRVKAKIKIISNRLDQIPIYELMKMHSSEADLVFVGIPEIEAPDQFIKETNELINTIGTTLLVKASSQFEETDLKVETIELNYETVAITDSKLIPLTAFEDAKLNEAIVQIDNLWGEVYKTALNDSIDRIAMFHFKQVAKINTKIQAFIKNVTTNPGMDFWIEIQQLLTQINTIYEDDMKFQLPEFYQDFDQSFAAYIAQKEESIYEVPKKIRLSKRKDNKGAYVHKPKKIAWNKQIERLWNTKGKLNLQSNIQEFGYQNYILLHQSKNLIHQELKKLVHQIESGAQLTSNFEKSFTTINEKINENISQLGISLYKQIRSADRALLNKLGGILEKTSFRREIQERLPYLNRREEKQLQNSLRNYSGYWQRNMVLFSLNMQADIYLIQFLVKIDHLVGNIKERAATDYIVELNKNIAVIQSNVATIKDLINTNKKGALSQYQPKLTADVYFNLDGIVQYVLDFIQNGLEKIPEEVVLMKANSVNSIRNIQEKEVGTIQVQLDDISDYLTKINFYKPFKDIVSNYINQLKKIISTALNGVYKLQNELENYAKTNQTEGLNAALEALSVDCESCNLAFQTTHQAFALELDNLKVQLADVLNINKIIEQYEIIYPQAKLESKGNKIKGQIKQYQNKIGGFLNKTVSKLIQRKEDSEKIANVDKFSHVLSPISIYQNFIAQFSIKPQVQINLPFYYDQLFSGKYYSDTEIIENRTNEVALIKNGLQKIDEGVSGGILILGESLSGKSYVANHIIHQVLKDADAYRLRPLGQKRKENASILRIIQTATGIQDSMSGIMHQLKPKSIFFIEDIETWFLNTENGSKLLNELSNLMHQYGSMHYFILTGNIFAYGSIKKHATINHHIIASIVLNPLTSSEIKKVIETRHHLGSMNYIYKTIPENYLSDSKKAKLMQRFYQNAKGNVGMALKYWISSIESVDENNIVISPVPAAVLPPFPDEVWQSMIYQFQLHKRLSRNDLNAIYGDSNKVWIYRHLILLEKAGLIKNIEKDLFEMPSSIRFFIEKKLYVNN